MIFFLSTVAYAQPNTKLYSELINQAELSLLDSNYARANQLYLNALNQHDFFAKDLNNAFFSAYYSKDSILTQRYIDTLAFYGFSIYNFDNDYFPNDPFIGKMLFRYLETQNVGKGFIDSTMLKIVDSFSSNDQLFRPDDDKDKMENGLNAIRDKANFTNYLDWVIAGQLPSYRNLGFYCKVNCGFTSSNITLMIGWHLRFARIPNRYYEFLKGLVSIGTLLPDDYLVIRPDLFEEYVLNASDASPADLAKINALRAELYLEPYGDFIKKMKYNLVRNGNVTRMRSKFIFSNNFVITESVRYGIVN